MCQLGICRLNGSCRIEYVPESLDQVKGSLYIRVLIEQYPASFGLVPGPIVGRFIKQVPTSGQELFSGVPVIEFFWDEGPVLFFCLLYLLVLPVYGVPPMFDPDILKGLQRQLLYVEPIRHLYRFWEAFFGDGLHRVRHIQGDFLDRCPFLGGYFHQLFHDGPHLGAGEYGHYRPFFTLGFFVGDYGVELPLGECRFVNGEVRSHIFGKDEPLFGMSLLLPMLELAQIIPVLPLEFLAIYPEERPKLLAAQGRIIR